MMARIASLSWAWLPVLLWMALIFSLSSRSDLPVRTNPQTGETIRTTFTLAKIGHVVEYGTLGLLLLRALMSSAGGLQVQFITAAVATVLMAALFGAMDEFRQSQVPNREPRLTDIALDTVSALGACLVVAGWRRVRRAGQTASSPQSDTLRLSARTGARPSTRTSESEP
ncbi:MAG: VanZ family protein [Chloroflexota bacterium]